MTPLIELPLWAAWLVVALALCGGLLALTGSIGLVVLKRFYERVHAPTLGATLGMTLIVLASMVFWSLSEGRFALRDLLIGVFLTVTTPVTLILLARAAAYRDRIEGDAQVPPE
ncbi:monovalent cation/H(+) antiporter subunit G [Brevundimonas bullata]|uniref:monovalent cation/H(+) antiporter subunit G n=1 Tax=Brevundimonas bullata TaxID=13160 RepID=UPI001986448C|nr:cation:proton antiporter [Brevundimonas sp.]